MFRCSDVLFQLVTAPEEINDDEDMMDTWHHEDGFCTYISTFQFHHFFSSVKCEKYVKLALRTQGLPPALRALRRESHGNLLDYVNTQ